MDKERLLRPIDAKRSLDFLASMVRCKSCSGTPGESEFRPSRRSGQAPQASLFIDRSAAWHRQAEQLIWIMAYDLRGQDAYLPKCVYF
jgi:hypothetical protein